MASPMLLRRQTYCRKYAVYLLLFLSLGCLFYLCFINTGPIGHEMRDAVWEGTGRVDLVERTLTESRYADREVNSDLWQRNGNHMAISELVHGVRGKLREILRHGDWERGQGAMHQAAGDYSTDTGAEVSENKGSYGALWPHADHKGGDRLDKAVPEEYRIPRIVHQTWEDLAIPGQVSALILIPITLYQPSLSLSHVGSSLSLPPPPPLSLSLSLSPPRLFVYISYLCALIARQCPQGKSYTFYACVGSAIYSRQLV